MPGSEAGLSLRALAERAGVAYTTLFRIEHGAAATLPELACRKISFPLPACGVSASDRPSPDRRLSLSDSPGQSGGQPPPIHGLHQY